MLFAARAKVNLTLEITGRRDDGYHTVDTVYQPISLEDRIFAERRPSGLVFSCSDRTLETQDNLVCRAFRLMRESFGFEGGLTLHLEKHIPYQAGLGGGSGDAACVLKICNEVFALGLSRERLAGLGGLLGADVPALLYDGASRGRGTGAETAPIRTDLVLPLLIVKPPVGLSTPAMYRKLDEAGPAKQEKISRSELAQEALEKGDAAALKAQLFNAFDRVAGEEEVARSRRELLRAGAEKAVLCGSGSAVFGVFANGTARDAACRELKEIFPEDWFICSADTVNEEKDI